MMKRAIKALVLTALLTGCALVTLTGSGNVVAREKAFTGFDRLDLSAGFRVRLRQADSFSVVIRVDDNVERYVDVSQRGSTLKIGLKWLRPPTLQDVTLEADVTMPELIGLTQSSGSHCTASGLESTKALDLDLSSGSYATLSGSAGDLTVEASSGSYATLGDLSVVNASVDASSGSEVTVNVSGRLDAAASSGSRIRYIGSPTLGSIDESSGSTVRPE